MFKLLYIGAGITVLLWGLLQVGLIPEALAPMVQYVVGAAFSLACPLFFLSMFLAPGLYRESTEPLRHYWNRLRTRRMEVEDLQRKIAQMDKAHHMLQLGTLYARQGRTRLATDWLKKAYEREPDSLEAQYRLALCHFDQGELEPAVELLERVHATKPDHDYGLAYLRLAECHQRLGNSDRASEIYETLLRFYPGQAEGSYHYAQLMESRGETERARRLMRELTISVRHSPAFQRRRNRHWLLKAYWWLWRHREN